MDTASLQRLALPGVASLVAFLAFSSQYLFTRIEPGPLPNGDAYIFNGMIACLYLCYARTCFTDPGRIPKDWLERTARKDNESTAQSGDGRSMQHKHRWCRRCEAPKPPRAHHCKTCKRCVMKMDHHCIWTANCVSHVTLPHFMRFLFYAVAAMVYLEYFLYLRAAVLWHNRKLPSYLGPSVTQLAHLFVLICVNSFVLFALTLLFGRTLWSLSLNMTTIEGWEVERHEAVLRRQRVLGGSLDAPDGSRVHVERQEFPWDVGIWTNLCQNLGSNNPVVWFWPLSSNPSIESGLTFEHNEIDDPSKPWPPPDPDRMFKAHRVPMSGQTSTHDIDFEGFRSRQAADQARYMNPDGEYVIRRRPFHERYATAAQPRVQELDDDEQALGSEEDAQEDDPPQRKPAGEAAEGEEAWRNAEGERLADFGVEEDVDFYDEDDVPLAELMRRRKAGQQ